MGAETWASVGVSLATAFAGVWAARAARRTPRQEDRAAFLAITRQQEGAIKRLEARVARQEKEAETARARSAEQERRAVEQEEVIAWLWSWLRSVVSAMRQEGREPPPAPQPIPDGADRYRHHLNL